MSYTRLVALGLLLCLLTACSIPGFGNARNGTEPVQTGSAQAEPLSPEDFQLQGLAIGSPSTELKQQFGEPETQEHNHGLGYHTLSYPAHGLVVYALLVGADEVLGWTAQRDSKFQTPRGIGIGAAREDVLARYGSQLAPDSTYRFLYYVHPENPEVRLGFDIINGKVARIQVGQEAVFHWQYDGYPARAMFPESDMRYAYQVEDRGKAPVTVTEDLFRDGTRMVGVYDGNPYVTWLVDWTGVWRLDPRGGGALLQYLPAELHDGAAWKQRSGDADIWFRLSHTLGATPDQPESWTLTVLNRGERTEFDLASGRGPVEVRAENYRSPGLSFTKRLLAVVDPAGPDRRADALKRAPGARGTESKVITVTPEEFEAAAQAMRK